MDSIVADYGGTVDKHIGDNVMAVFGAPIAHDDDPLRAVRAAFEIHRQVGQLHDSRERKLEVHVGIASGQVVASGTGSDKHRQYTVTGDSVNLAARLQSRAEAGETLISNALFRAVAHEIDCESLGEVDVKGIEAPVAVWRVKSQRVTDGQATRISFVGREAELAQLAGIVETCLRSGRGRAVVIRGEAGIGKTRLVEEFTRIAAANGFKVHRGLVLDFGVGEGRDAIRAVVQSLLEIPSGSDAATRQAAANAAIGGGLLAPERRIFLNDLLDLAQSQEERGIYDAMANATRNEGKRAVVAEILRSLSAKQPVAVVIEDIHWAGPLILAYLARIAGDPGGLPGAARHDLACRGISAQSGMAKQHRWLSFHDAGPCPLAERRFHQAGWLPSSTPSIRRRSIASSARRVTRYSSNSCCATSRSMTTAISPLRSKVSSSRASTACQRPTSRPCKRLRCLVSGSSWKRCGI